MYQVTDGMLDRMAALVARGDGDGLRRYLGHIVAKGETLQPLREAMDLKLVACFHAVAYEVAPWLAEDSFGPSPTSRVVEAIEAAGYEGTTAGELRLVVPGARLDHALGELVRDGDVVAFNGKTGGRPSVRYRMATAENPSADPFAWKPPTG